MKKRIKMKIYNKSRYCAALIVCDRDWIRTSTPFPAPPPQGGASTNFATRPCFGIANLIDKIHLATDYTNYHRLVFISEN